MALPKFFDVDENVLYHRRKNVLNDLFRMKTKDGDDFEKVPRSVWNINKAKGKKVWFPYLAECVNGVWKPHENIGWLNIPSADHRAITQIELAGKPAEEKETPTAAEYAVFIYVQKDKDYDYRFYGVFTPVYHPENGITEWTRISSTVDLEEWEADE
jgi:hypothetical protein